MILVLVLVFVVFAGNASSYESSITHLNVYYVEEELSKRKSLTELVSLFEKDRQNEHFKREIDKRIKAFLLKLPSKELEKIHTLLNRREVKIFVGKKEFPSPDFGETPQSDNYLYFPTFVERKILLTGGVKIFVVSCIVKHRMDFDELSKNQLKDWLKMENLKTPVKSIWSLLHPK